MLRMPRWSNRRKAAVAAALALLLWIPQGVSQRTQPVVTGHSTFYNAKGYDPCLASIAGILKSQVMWFNDMVLAETFGSKGTFVYVTENASADPRAANYLYTDGVFYDFTDPNGVHWHVDEAFMAPLNPDATADPQSAKANDPASAHVKATPIKESDRTYVWIVELSQFPIHDQFAGDPSGPYAHDIYNFLVMIDTCKFHRTHDTNFNSYQRVPNSDSYDFNVTHEGNLGPANGHPVGETAHQHESFYANLWIGRQPLLIPFNPNQETVGYESSWASTQAPGVPK